jgi:hypothetical protein
VNEQNPNMSNPRSPGAESNGGPKSGVLGAHPVGVGLGAVGAGAAAGAVGGAIAGPVGAVAGAAVGAVVGGLAGKAAAEAVNPTVETTYWRENHAARPYAHSDIGYIEYAPAYRYGWESFGRRGGQGQTFESVEADLGRGWDKAKGLSHLGWDKAKEASREAWNRVRIAANGHAPQTETAAPVPL